MSSPRNQPTRVQPPAPQPAPAPAAAAPLDLRTLIITAVASAAAAFICSKVWAPGTLASAAFTPVAVAVFREALRKPTEVVTTALPGALPIARRSPGAPGPYGAPTGAGSPFAADDPTRVHDAVPGPSEGPTRLSPTVGPEGPGAVGESPVTIHAVAPSRRRRWQIAVVTGILGFVIAALLITVPEVIAGKDSTTIFRDGGRSTPTKTEATPATTTTTETVTPKVTTVAPETVTRTETVPTTTSTETQTVTEQAPATTTTRTTPTTTSTTPDEGVDPGAAAP